MIATRCPGRPASPVHFLYHILSLLLESWVKRESVGLKNIHCFELLRIHFACKEVQFGSFRRMSSWSKIS